MADGRLHLTGARLLAPHLTAENVEGLIAASTHKRKAAIEQLVAERFPQSDVPTLVQAIPLSVTRPGGEDAPGHADGVDAPPVNPSTRETEISSAAGQNATPIVQMAVRTPAAPFPKVMSLAPERFALQVMISKTTHDKLRHAQDLLSHAVPSGDVAQVLDRALDALIKHLEKSKFAATERPRQSPRRTSTSKRHIPAHVKRAVRERDQGQVNSAMHQKRQAAHRAAMIAPMPTPPVVARPPC